LKAVAKQRLPITRICKSHPEALRNFFGIDLGVNAKLYQHPYYCNTIPAPCFRSGIMRQKIEKWNENKKKK
jgi:hypothetical protein